MSITSLPLNLMVKDFKNWSAFDEVEWAHFNLITAFNAPVYICTSSIATFHVSVCFSTLCAFPTEIINHC